MQRGHVALHEGAKGRENGRRGLGKARNGCWCLPAVAAAMLALLARTPVYADGAVVVASQTRRMAWCCLCLSRISSLPIYKPLPLMAKQAAIYYVLPRLPELGRACYGSDCGCGCGIGGWTHLYRESCAPREGQGQDWRQAAGVESLRRRAGDSVRYRARQHRACGIQEPGRPRAERRRRRDRRRRCRCQLQCACAKTGAGTAM